MRSYLVVSNQTLGGAALAAKVRALLEEGPGEFHIVVPATPPHHGAWTEGEARAIATERLDAALGWFGSIGATATGEVADEHPLYAIRDALRDRPSDARRARTPHVALASPRSPTEGAPGVRGAGHACGGRRAEQDEKRIARHRSLRHRVSLAERAGFEPARDRKAPRRFRGAPIRPLSHLSAGHGIRRASPRNTRATGRRPLVRAPLP